MQVSGKVIKADVQKGTSKAGKEWQKKNFVIEFNEGTRVKQYAFELFGEDNINNNPFRVGSNVTVTFDINCSEWNGRWFTQLQASRVEKLNIKAGQSVENEVSSPEPMFKDLAPEEALPF